MAQITVTAVLDRSTFDPQAQALQTFINTFSNSNPIRIRIDTSSITNATTRINSFASSANTAFSSAQQGASQATQNMARYGQQIQNTTQQLQNMGNAAQNAWNQWNQGTQGAGRGTRDVADATDLLGRRIQGLATASAWRAITGQIKQALAAMKEVDRELVTIRKVTGFNEGQISAIGQSAYSVSSQYGVVPQEYLASVANFARAGYKEAATTLGELAVKTQLVGDVSQETANQMLLAVDAAYKYGGSAEKLSAVLDGMNEIDNNFATSIDKISSGLGKVTSIGAQAGVSIGELSAAIGTITAVTQRSGTEAATALRALFLNIMGDTKTEIEDGAKWTAGEIEGLRDVLRTYAPEVVNAAAATGQLINPMEAIGALSKAMQEGLLTEQELMQMVSDIGGKLRSSQLLALIQNWDMYSAQLDAFKNSAGSAGEEVARMLDSWEVKANQLDASWTKLTSDVLDSSFIKGTLDFLRGVTELLDSNGGLPAKFVAVAAGISAMSLALRSLQASTSVRAFFDMLRNPYALALAASAVLISEVVKALESANLSQGELEDNARKSADEYDRQKSALESVNAQITANKKLMDDIISKGADATGEEQNRLSVLKEQTAELLRQQKIEEYKTAKAGLDAAKAAAAAMNGRGYYSQFGYDIFSSNNLLDTKGQGYALAPGVGITTTRIGEDSDISSLLAYYGQLINGKKLLDTKIETAPDNNAVLEEYGEQNQWYIDEIARIEGFINDYISESADNAKSISDYIETYLRDVPYEKMTSDQKMLVDTYQRYTETSEKINEFMGVTTGPEASGTSVRGGAGGYNEPRQLSDWTIANDKHAQQLRNLNQAIREFNEHGYVSTGTAERMAAAGYDLSDSMVKADLGYVTTAADLKKLSDETAAWYEKFGIAMPESMESIGAEADQASLTLAELASNALTLQDNAYGAAKALKDLQDGLKGTGEKGDTFKALQQEYANVMKLIKEGRWNSNEARGFMDMLFGPDAIKEVGGYQVMSEWLGKDYFKSFFTDDALTTLEKWAKTLGEVKDENGELIASFAKNDDGTFDVVINDIDKLSEKLKIPSDMLAAFFDELGNFGNIEDFGGAEKLLDGMGESVETLADGTKKVNLAGFVQELVEAGQSSTNIRELINTLRDMDSVKIDGDFSKLGEMIETCEKAKAAKDSLDESANKPVVVESSSGEVKESESDVLSLQQAVKKFQFDDSQLNVTSDSGEVEDSESDVQGLRDAVHKYVIDEDQFNLNVKADSSQVQTASSDVETLANKVEDFGGEDGGGKEVSVKGKDEGVSKVKEAVEGLKGAMPLSPLSVDLTYKGDKDGNFFSTLADGIKSLVSKTVDVVVNYKATGSGTPNLFKNGVPSLNPHVGEDAGLAFATASGTDFSEGGPTLVNEKGPELIAQKGRAFVANGGRPTIVNLDRGAIVYNADETRELLVGGGISSYGIASRSGDGDKEKEMVNAALTISGITGKKDDKGGGSGGGKTSSKKPKKSDDDWWKILEESYEYALAKAKDTVSQLDLKITHIKNEIADAKRPLEDQIKEYEKINKQIDRQIQLLNRAKERATKPIQDQIDALKAQKDVQDEQLALEEKQKAVEEARANLQNAQQERTIRFYNQETGHWEWMADQKAIDDAQKNLDSAEKALADQEFNMQISALEREKDRIEKEFDDQITQLNEQKTVNEDAIYALNEAIDAIDDAYAPELNALEREKELMDRELSDTEAEWAHLQFQRQKKPKGNINKAANKLGAKGKAAKEIIDSLSGSIKDIESAAAAGTLDALTASVANSLIYGSPSTVTSAVGSGIGYNGGMADSHDIIINGIVFSNEGAYKSFTDGLAALGIYAGE